MNFSLQPVLAGVLVYLRPLAAEDFNPLFQVASDPLIWEQHPMWDRYKIEVFTNFFSTAMKSKSLAICQVGSNDIIGSSRFYSEPAHPDRVYIGYTFLARNYWGGAYNREIKFLMLTHAFQHVDQVYFQVWEKNIRTQKSLENLGATLLSKIDRLDLFDGHRVDSLVYHISKTTWQLL